jgi:hypothetical protein
MILFHRILTMSSAYFDPVLPVGGRQSSLPYGHCKPSFLTILGDF